MDQQGRAYWADQQGLADWADNQGLADLKDRQGLAEILIQLVHWRADEVEPLNSLRRAGF